MAQALQHGSLGGGATEETLTKGQHRTIFFASILTLIAAGIGFAVRGAILDDWGAQFGFTKTDLGTITGGGLTGFGLTIIVCSFFADRIGYKTVLTGAFILHVLSALITLAASLVYKSAGREATYWTLFVGMFIFALGNGLCEAAINPLTATLFPKNKTHYLNILHAGWPAGLVLGAVFAFCFAGDHAQIKHLHWEIPMLFFLVPTLLYGLLVLKNPFPVSEAKAAGVSMGAQIAAIFAPLLIFLFLIHGLVGYVELGTDSWITNIMNNVKTTIQNWGLLLFIYISMLMFILRFFAGPIVHKINPLGLLMLAACFGTAGLYLLGTVQGLVMITVAGTVYALGKTFYWPTMLGVIGERYPKGGALAMGISGGIGMISAGMLGGPGIGYFQDRFASHDLETKSAVVYNDFKDPDPKRFPEFLPENFSFEKIQGLNGSKVAVAKDGGAGLMGDVEIAKKAGTYDKDKNLKALNAWYENDAVHLKNPDITVDGKSKSADDKPYGLGDLKEGDKVAVATATDGTVLSVNDVRTGVAIPELPTVKSTDGLENTLTVANTGGAPKTYNLTSVPRSQVQEANIVGGRKALQVTAFVPAAMAVCYLLLVLYFAARGGYKPLHLETSGEEVAGPTEGL